jgi:hypothetical protein
MLDAAQLQATDGDTARSGALCGAAALAETVFVLADGATGIDAAVVLQAPVGHLPKQARRNLPSRALLRIDGSQLWLVELRGCDWNTERLGRLAELIRTHHRARWRTLAQFVEDLFEFPGVSVRRPSLDDLNPSAWPTRPIAVALVLTRARTSAGQVHSTSVEELAAVLKTRLLRALNTLKGALDAECFATAVRYPDMVADAYGYLAEPARRKYRQQFAVTLPTLLPAVVGAVESSPFAAVRAAVDDGEPLVSTGAAALRVSPATLRGLIGQDLAVVGPRWAAAPLALLRLLDAVRPEARPGRNGCDWERVNRLVDGCEAATGRCVDASFFARAWVREQLHRVAASGAPLAAPELAAREIVAIDQLREQLLVVLLVEVSSLGAPAADADVVAMYVDRELQRVTLKKLRRLAHEWQQRLSEERLADRSLVEFVRGRGDRCWPLLREPYASEDRSRLVVPLVTADELIAHGQALGICLAGSAFGSYLTACRKGRISMLGIRDSATGRPLSTAELRLSRAETGALAPVVVQHTGVRNARPDEACQTALREALLTVLAPAGQAHLQTWRTALRGFRQRTAVSPERVEAQASIRAFRAVLGDAHFDALLQGARSIAASAVCNAGN